MVGGREEEGEKGILIITIYSDTNTVDFGDAYRVVKNGARWSSSVHVPLYVCEAKRRRGEALVVIVVQISFATVGGSRIVKHLAALLIKIPCSKSATVCKEQLKRKCQVERPLLYCLSF